MKTKKASLLISIIIFILVSNCSASWLSRYYAKQKERRRKEREYTEEQKAKNRNEYFRRLHKERRKGENSITPITSTTTVRIRKFERKRELNARSRSNTH